MEWGFFFIFAELFISLVINLNLDFQLNKSFFLLNKSLIVEKKKPENYMKLYFITYFGPSSLWFVVGHLCICASNYYLR